MKTLTRVCTVVGAALLALGVGSYARLALTREGSLLWSFLFCMTSLLFFNLPVVVRRVRDRKPYGSEKGDSGMKEDQTS